MINLMKRLLAYLFLVLGLVLVANVKADDIRDFQIEGMGVGDSLLDYLEKNKIDNSIHAINYKSNKFKTSTLKLPLKEFDMFRVSYKSDDSKYIIYGISGILVFKNNINDCYKKKDEIVNELKNLYIGLEIVEGKFSHPVDKTGKSKVNNTGWRFNDGSSISIACTDYSKTLNKKGKLDHLRVAIMENEYQNFLLYEAY